MRPANIVAIDLIIQTILITTQICLQVTLWRAATRAAWKGGRRLVLGILLAVVDTYLLLALMVGNSGLPFRLTLPQSWNRPLLFPSNLYLFACAGSYAVYLVYRFLARRFLRVEELRQVNSGRRLALQAIGYATIAAPATTLALGATIGRTDFQVREVAILVPGLHPDLEGLRIVQLSDLHLGDFLAERELARVIDTANTLRGHFGLVTGDLITRAGDPLPAAVRQLARFKTDAGAFGCMGNHEIYANTELLTEQMCARIGIPFLRKTSQILRFGQGQFNLAGVDFQTSRRKDLYLKGTEKLIVPGIPNFLLSHNPDVFLTSISKGFDVTFAGHTHGGQITMEILDQTLNFARFYTPFVSGLYTREGKSLYVTRGIGTIGIPSRVGAFPEITLITLKRA
jgi:predicted MPP superfamily phosphohydrolase